MKKCYKYRLERAKEDIMYALLLKKARYRAFKKYYEEYSCVEKITEYFHIFKTQIVILLLQLFVRLRNYLDRKK